MESPRGPVEVVDYFTAGTTEKDQGCKAGQVADEDESLPHHLKRLFLYCSLFPSGYEFSKDELIQLWIAEGFIRERQNQRMEDTASEHFNSLEKEGFFLLSRCDFSSVLSTPTGNFLYKVNPIKHSMLGDRISSGNYFRAVDGKLAGASEMTRHLSLICEDIDGRTFGILRNFKHLRTLHLLSCRGSSIKHVPRDFCFTLTVLRTLNLSGTLISELPSSVGNVKSLRYIDASHTPISRLPESIDSLHNLQTLKLRGCIHFAQLPKGMKRLSNLRHIDVDIIRQLDSMPAHLGNLSNLQTLPAFLVGRDDGCHVGELKKLNDLKGAFNISRLENVLSKEEAEEAALIDKKRIHSLELRWSNLFVENAEQQEKVLECLQPHSGLKELQIQQYSGSILPTWISNPTFADLVVITLYRCRNCKLLPCMGQLPALKSLSIIEVNEVKEINRQFFRNGPVDHAFPKLERLEVDIMLNLKEWKDIQMGDLPSLVKLTVGSCPELVTIPPLSCLKSLKHLEFRRCPKLLSLPTVGLPTSLESFLVLDCLKLKEWWLNSEYWSMLCHVPSVWFDNEEGPCGITHQSDLAHVTTHISTEYSSSLSAAPATSLTRLPAFCKTMEPQEMPSKIPNSAVSIKKSSDTSHLDQRSQPSSFTYLSDVDESLKSSDNIGANDCDGKRLKTAARCRDESLEAKAEAETSSGKPLEQNTQPPDPPKQDYIHVQTRMDQATNSHSFAERARRKRMNIFQDLVPGYYKCWKPFGHGDGEGRGGGGIDSIGIVCSKLGGRNDKDKLLSFHDIGKYAWGDFSMAVVQANQDLEDQGQIEFGPFGTFIGIYDGHGGPEAAQYVCDNLFRHFQVSAKTEGVVTEETIQNAFCQTEEGFTALVSQLWSTKPKLATVGSCCLVGVICQGTLFVASLGNSSLVLGKKVSNSGEVAAIQLSTEHNVNRAEIRHELKELHSHDPQIVVLKHGVWRVKGLIQVSRSIGDVYMKHARFNREPTPAKFRIREPMNKPYMSANPTILSHALHPDDSFLIFASDGLWEYLSNERAVEIVNMHPHAGSARRLVKTALKEAARKRDMRYSDLQKIDKKVRRHFHDDITVIVLFLNHDLMSRGTVQKIPPSQ